MSADPLDVIEEAVTTARQEVERAVAVLDAWVELRCIALELVAAGRGPFGDLEELVGAARAGSAVLAARWANAAATIANNTGDRSRSPEQETP